MWEGKGIAGDTVVLYGYLCILAVSCLPNGLEGRPVRCVLKGMVFGVLKGVEGMAWTGLDLLSN